MPNYLHLDRMEVQKSEVGRVAAIWSTRDDPTAKACFGFASAGREVDLRDRVIERSTERITEAATAITLKDYSALIRT